MEKSESAPENVIVFLFLSLFVGIIVTFSLTRILPSLPYTVVVFALGILFAFLLTGAHTNNALSASLQLWNSINPDLIFYLFLPPLLFGEAMNLNFYHVRGVSLGSILLAGPGAIIQTFAVAIIVFYLLPYKWSWIVCLLFGSIISATDPVAVISILKKHGVSNRLQYLIIGESLLNDGAALALFIMFSDWIRRDGSSWSAVRIIIYFVKFVFLSPLLGIAFGFGTLFCMSVANKRMLPEDNVIQISLTICCAYLSFYVAQHTLDISGALACCVAGLVLARFAKPLIIQVESMRSVWEVMEWTGNTLIFILAGLIIGTGTISFLRAYDLLFILLAYVVVLLVRGAIIALFYPILSFTGKGLNVREALFISYGGLRGAVSVALALSLVHSTTSGHNTIDLFAARTVFFLSGGVAALTLLINATTSGMVLNYLQLLPNDSATSEVRIMRQYVKKRLRLKALVLLEQLQEKYPDNVDPQVVWQYCSILHGSEKLPVNPCEAENIHVSSNSGSRENSNVFTRFCKGTFSSCLTCCTWSTCTSQDIHVTSDKQVHPYLHFPFPNLELSRQKSQLPPSFLDSAMASAKVPSESTTVSITYENILGQKLEQITKVALPDEYSRIVLTHRRPIAVHQNTSNRNLIPRWHRLIHRFELAEDEEQKKSPAEVNHLDDTEVEEIKSEDNPLDNEETIVLSKTETIRDSLSPAHQPAHQRRLHRHRLNLFGLSDPDRNNIRKNIPTDESAVGSADGERFSVDGTHVLRKSQPSSNEPSSVTPPQPSPLHAIENIEEKQNILTQIRRAFLEIVRVHYWRQIHSGRLPRKSQSIVILLNSIDYALELSHTSGLDDWAYIVEQHSYLFWDLKCVSSPNSETVGVIPSCTNKHDLEELEKGDMRETKEGGSFFLPEHSLRYNEPSRVNEEQATIRIGRQVHFDSVSNIFSSKFSSATSNERVGKHRSYQGRNGSGNNFQRDVSNNVESESILNRVFLKESPALMRYRHAQVVYLLVAFLEAHEYAQMKIRFYIGDSEGIPIRDENVVIEESQVLVDHAKQILSCIDRIIVTQQLSKQAARWILHVQEDTIMEFREEGVITGADAEVMLHEIQVDRNALSSQDHNETDNSSVAGERKSFLLGDAIIQCLLTCSAWARKLIFFMRNAMYGFGMYCQRHCQ